jgi:hypothetical protein
MVHLDRGAESALSDKARRRDYGPQVALGEAHSVRLDLIVQGKPSAVSL